MSYNSWQYGYSNPVRYTDPLGLFSRDQIASSFGKNSFDAVLASYNDRDGRWGLLAALLQALPGDTLYTGAPDIGFDHPAVRWHGHYRLGYETALGITVGNESLTRFLRERFLLDGKIGTGDALTYWRDTSPRHYLLVQPRLPGVLQFVDGSDYTELPDFVSSDFGGSVGVVGATLSPFIRDRFGNRYWSLFVGVSVGAPITLQYSEGYVSNSAIDTYLLGNRLLPSEETIKRWLLSTCLSAQAGVFLGGGIGSCPDGTNVAVFLWGFNVGVSAGISFSGWLGKDSSAGWNWAIDARRNGIRRHQVLSMPEVTYCP
jgi:hypothetical protein